MALVEVVVTVFVVVSSVVVAFLIDSTLLLVSEKLGLRVFDIETKKVTSSYHP